MDIGKITSAFVIFISAIVEVLILFRIALLLFAANNRANFTDWIYSSTDSLVAPFAGVFPEFNVAGLVVVELSSILALIVYGVIAAILIFVLRMFEGTKVHGPKTSGGSMYSQPQQQAPVVQAPQQQYVPPAQMSQQPTMQPPQQTPNQPQNIHQPSQQPDWHQTPAQQMPTTPPQESQPQN